MSNPYPTNITTEEVAAGFVVGQLKNPTGHYATPFGAPPASHVPAVVRPLATGLKAVKVQRPDGVIEYAIFDATDRPVYLTAPSLVELERRFP
jgi:hypothetical protein